MNARGSTSRDAIVRAALAGARDRGWAETSMQEVRLRAGVSNGSLFHHFPTRQDLESAVVAAGLVEHDGALLAELRASTGAREGVRGVVVRHLAWVREHPRVAVLLLSARPPVLRAAIPPEVVEDSRRFFAEVAAWLRRHGWSGQPGLPVVTALWLGPANDVARGWLTAGGEEPAGAVAAVVADAAWDALRAHLRADA
ncbi:AcrR family transcriptional regulator [Geodermatophilus bullaregiensis]|uniref:TetR/AcrR family transcriptional regulator n=1 Tax=Geodermatophilus bullaregiensis TaxID=1564160 RepID=UPI00195658AE|nr:TetR/AcrR family transcriptional regulator [Geodermatophilus bullaregiensis]MBM7808896.1 AcrR family transcriptional regulator [Geodermatophilus bullaregiensis]